MKKIITNYIFDKTAKTITFPDYSSIDIERISLITHVQSGTFIYIFNGGTTNGGTISGNVLTLNYNTSSFSNSDDLRIDFEPDTPTTDSGALMVGNARTKFRDGFASPVSQPQSSVWIANQPGSDHIITQGGNSSGSSYLRISLSPFVDGSEYSLLSKQLFRFPMRIGFGISTSQRITGQEVFFGMVADDGTGSAVDSSLTPTYTDAAITGSTIVVASNIGTVTLTNHGLVGGDRITIYGCQDSRANVGPVTVTIIDKNTFQVPIVNSAGSYSSVGGFIRVADPLLYASNGAGYLLENTTVTNSSIVSRRNGAKFRTQNVSVASTAGSQTNTNSYTDAWNSAGNQELELVLDEVRFRSFSSDSSATQSGMTKYTNTVPDDDLYYHIQMRARNLKGMTMPIAQITSISKTGTTTATVTTDVSHGLTTNDWIQIYGVRDITNFPALTSAAQVASIISSTQFTVVIGTAVTASSAGGAVWRVQGGTPAPGVMPQSIQSVSRSNNVLTVIGNAAWTTPIPGEYMHIWGMDGSAAIYDGAYKVLRVNATSLELESIGANFGSINCGGTVIRRTDVRIHFSRVMDYTRHVVEVAGGRGNTTDVNNSVPVSITGATTVPASQSTGSISTVWNAAGVTGLVAVDVASAALTSSNTTAAITPGVVANLGSYSNQFGVAITAVSGTTPTMDVVIQESPDNGNNWTDVYHFPRLTTTGLYNSPQLPNKLGSRYRYVRTLGGTTPSFTHQINRTQFSTPAPFIRQFFDRTISLTTASSTTPTFNVDGSSTIVFGIKIGSATTAPIIKLQGNYDGTSTGWFDLVDSSGAVVTLTAVANQYVTKQINNVSIPQVRAIISTVGATVTSDYVFIRAIGA